ncbi:g4436 [Coccomyxa elongata]
MHALVASLLGFVAALLIIKALSFLVPFKRAAKALQAQGIPRAPAGNPLAANAPWKRMDLHRLGQDDCERLGGIFYFRILFFNCVQISDPWLASAVLELGTKRPDLIDKPRGWPLPIYDCFDRGTSDPPQPCLISTATADPYWRVVRKGVAPAFNSTNIRKGFGTVLEVAKRLVDRLKEHGAESAIDIDGALQCESFDVIGSVGFGHDFRATADLAGPGAVDCRTIKEGCAIGVNDMRNPLRPVLRALPFLPEAWNHRRAVHKVQYRLLNMMRSLVEEVRSRGVRSEEEDCSIGGHLMRVRDAAGQPLPYVRLWSELSIFFMAGMETTAHAITWALYLISQHPEVEARLAAELDEAGLLVTPERPQPRDLTHADLSRLTYLNCVLKESQRMYSVAPLVLRKALADVQIGRYTIPAGTAILIHVFAMHNTSRNYERHTEFLPERWLEPNAEMARRVVPEQSAAPGCSSSRNNLSSSQSVSSVAVDCTASAAVPLWGREKAGDSSSTAEEASRGGVPSSGADLGTSPDSHHEYQKVKRFMPFLEGNRQCIGMSLAKLNYTTAVALLLSHFTFRLADDMGGPQGVRDNEVYFVTIQPKERLNMHVIPRPTNY